MAISQPTSAVAAYKTYEVTTDDGRSLFTRAWLSPDVEKILLVVHGLGEHSAWYQRLADYVVPRGLSVVAFDQQGHGLSPGARGRILSYDQLLDDIEQVHTDTLSRFQPTQCMPLGHSMGGNLLLNYLLRRGQPASPTILSNPMILPANPPTRPQIFAAWLTGKILPWLRVSSAVEPSSLTHDTEILRELGHDPRSHGKMSLQLGTQLLSRGQEVIDRADEIPGPLLILLGGADEICDRSTTQTLISRLDGRCEVQRWPELRHALLLESQRIDVYHGLLAWSAQC